MDHTGELSGSEDSTTDELSSSEDSTDDERYNVWWRHSGEAEIESIPEEVTTTICQISEILEDIGDNEITHMVLWDTIPSSLHQIAPKLHSLKIADVEDNTELNRLATLTQLKELDFSHNFFSDGLPQVIGELSSLTVLKLMFCGLTDLPDKLATLTQLKELDLKLNGFSNGLPQVVGELSSLTVLNLMFCGLTDLPDNLATLTQLKELELSHNEFSNGLPQVVGELSSLTVLKLAGCKLTDLPDNLATLTQLKELDLSCNTFSKGLPQVIGELSSLTVLKLASCKLTDLPDNIATLTQLKELDLTRNKFSNGLPQVVGELSSLTVLKLAGCALTDLPDNLATLTQLKELDLSHGETRLRSKYNNFSEGLPPVLGELSSLTVLNLADCELTDLPDNFSQLTALKDLDLSHNQFYDIPSIVFTLKTLTKLNIRDNKELTSISKDVLFLENLVELNCYGCDHLTSPPYAVCEQGISAVRQYYIDLKNAKSVNLTVVPIAVIGCTLAGKTSLTRSLQEGTPKYTYRTEASVLDEATKVFEVNDLVLKSSRARLIDHGGHSVYHITYRYILKAQNVPLIVVNLEEFSSISSVSGTKEATKTTCWDWLSHLYLSSPSLGPPILVLTHADKLSSGDATRCKGEILCEAEVIKQEMLAEDIEQFGQQQSQLNRILHLSNEQIPIFHDEDIFMFGKDDSETSNIEALREKLDRRCAQFTSEIPQLWEDVHRSINAEKDKPYIPLSEIQSRYPADGCLTTIRYLHNTGDILWFEHVPTLKQYIFHQIPKMTEMISTLFHHRSEEEWERRKGTFAAFRHGERMINREKYEEMIEEFGSSGVIDEALLIHLLKSETKFPPDVALELLQCFNIIHGPIGQSSGRAYVIPYFTTSDMDTSWETEGRLQVRLDIKLRGLSLPMYGYHLTAVAVLNKLMSPSNSLTVTRDGVTVYHGECATQLIHSSEERNITLQVSTEAEQLGNSWKHLLKTAKDIIELLSNTWIACRPFVRVYCSHCLFLRDPQPSYRVDPDWFHPIPKRSPTDSACTDVDTAHFSGAELVTCKQHATRNKSNKPSVPKPLSLPCYQLTADDINKVNNYLKNMESKRFCKPPERVQRLPRPPPTDDEDSELSDSLEYLDETDGSLDIISMRVEPCAKAGIRELYFSDSVYRMSSPTRGRCLIINNMNFGGNEKRVGSEKDVKNISDVFDHLSFQCFVQRDLSSQQMLEVIEKETELSDHKDFGMFVLVIMTHGLENHLYGSDGEKVERTKINEVLSAQKFPSMAGKPKLVILQACSGTRYDTDGGQTATQSSTSATQQTTSSQPLSTDTSPSLTISVPAVPSADCLAGDDLFIMRASFSGYRSIRSPSHGCWFIRALVEALYKHSCHRDIRTLFEEQVTKKVRKKSKAAVKIYPCATRQQPTMDCPHTEGRKLYLFPGYNPPSQ